MSTKHKFTIGTLAALFAVISGIFAGGTWVINRVNKFKTDAIEEYKQEKNQEIDIKNYIVDQLHERNYELKKYIDNRHNEIINELNPIKKNQELFHRQTLNQLRRSKAPADSIIKYIQEYKNMSNLIEF